MNARWTMMLAAAVAIVAIVTGCGSGSGDKSTSEAQPAGEAETQSTSQTASGDESQAQTGDGAPETTSGSKSNAQSGGPAGGEPSLSKTAFDEKAHAVCRKARKNALAEVEEYENSHRSEGLPAGVLAENALRATVLSTLETEIAGIRRLASETKDGKQIEAIVSEMEATLEEAIADTELSYIEVEELFAASDRKLQAYGVVGCSKG